MNSSYGKPESPAATPPSPTERVFAVLVLVLSSGAFMTLTTTEGQISNQAGSMPMLEILWMTIYLITIGLLIRHCPGFVRQLLREWPLAAFVALAVLSILWSDDPSITFRRSVALCLTVMFGFYLARRFPIKEQLHLLAWTCSICMFFSVPFQLLHVGSVVHAIPGAWHGIFVQKGLLGITMALGVLVFLLLSKENPKRRWQMRVGIASAVVLLILSRSVTAYIATAFMFALLPLTGILRKSLGKALTGIILVAIAGTVALFWALTHLATFTGAMGKSITMSGRLQLWALCVVMALRKPWLGYGYSAFWLGMHGPSYRIWEAMGVQMPHAHNSFLQAWLGLGLAGMGLLVLILFVYSIRAALLVRRTCQPEEVWPLMFFGFIFLFMLTGVPIPSVNSLLMIIFSSSIFAVASPVRERARESACRKLGDEGHRIVRPSLDSTAQGTSSA